LPIYLVAPFPLTHKVKFSLLNLTRSNFFSKQKKHVDSEIEKYGIIMVIRLAESEIATWPEGLPEKPDLNCHKNKPLFNVAKSDLIFGQRFLKGVYTNSCLI
jgi:hypothetical protein